MSACSARIAPVRLLLLVLRCWPFASLNSRDLSIIGKSSLLGQLATQVGCFAQRWIEKLQREWSDRHPGIPWSPSNVMDQKNPNRIHDHTILPNVNLVR